MLTLFLQKTPRTKTTRRDQEKGSRRSRKEEARGIKETTRTRRKEETRGRGKC